jgi:ligand-binding SRPBCC domain-containing protein
MRAGATIAYRLRVHGLPIRWTSEITAWEPPYRFVDEQRRGPYRLWHHTHTFEEQSGGTLARDSVRYAVPFGRLAHRLIVRRDVEQIFAFRQEALKRIFATGGEAGTRPESEPPTPIGGEAPGSPRVRRIDDGG